MNSTRSQDRRRCLRVRTPEGIVFAHELAGVGERAVAWFIDSMVVLAAWSVLRILIALMVLLNEGFAELLDLVLFFAMNYGYAMVMEWSCRGQTLGKKLLRIRVIDVEGLRLKPGQVILRNLLRLVDCLPVLYLVGGAMSVLNPHGQRLGDLASGTTVVRVPIQVQPDLERITQGKFNSLRDHPHLCARIRGKISPEHAAIALQAILRRDDFDDVARVTLFREITAMVREHVDLPQEVCEGLSDEQLIRNVVDVLYRNTRDQLMDEARKLRNAIPA